MADLHHGSQLPLAGIRVVELASVLAAPYAGYVLALLGAEVVKVEPAGGDPFRRWGSSEGTGGVFGYVNAGKKSVVVDLRDADSTERLRRLVSTADVVVCSGRAGAWARHGLGPQDCLAIRPNLTFVSLTGFGDRGPRVDRPAYDNVVQSLSGLLHAYGVQGDVVSERLPPLADLLAGLVVSQAALAGLVRSSRGGVGGVFETSLYEAACSVMGAVYVRADPLVARRSQQSLIFQFRCLDDAAVTVQLSTNDRFWENLCTAVDPTLGADPELATYTGRIAHYDDIHGRLETFFATRTANEWEELLADADVPCARILSPTDALADPQLQALGMVTPDDGGHPVAGAPWRIDGHRPERPSHVPAIGEHDDLLEAP